MNSAPFQYVPLPSEASVLEALKRWPGGTPEGGMLVLVAESDRESVPHIQKAFAGAGRPLAGAVFPELIVDEVFVTGGALLLPLPGETGITLVEGLSGHGDAESALAQVAEMVEARNAGNGDTLFLIFDCMVPDIGTLLDGLYLSLADRVHYAGVNAGSETFQPIDCLFDGERFVGDAALALLLPDQPGAILAHNYHAPTEVITATAASGNRVTTIDWQPAFDVYQRLIQSMYGVKVTPENFYQHAAHFPLGILRLDGEVVVRIPVALGEDGDVTCVGEIPENAVLTLLRAVEADAPDTVRHVARYAAEHPSPLMQTFYCAGRRMHLGDAARRELADLHERLKGTRMAGALSLGEIGSEKDGGYPLFHNATLVCMPWGAVRE
ncbi:MAG: FIST C-terminal domain-containing protein [Nitrospirota bacterium]|nr:FIST C-terminal domain-containing protein [Nitrospirota bacterium]